jgi:type III restriction enzyme
LVEAIKQNIVKMPVLPEEVSRARLKEKESDKFVEHYEDFDDVRKINRLKTWCEDVNRSQTDVKYITLYVKQEDWEKDRESIKKFEDVVKVFKVV